MSKFTAEPERGSGGGVVGQGETGTSTAPDPGEVIRAIVEGAMPGGVGAQLLRAEQQREGKGVVEAAEQVARCAGHFLVSHGLGDLWRDLFRHLADTDDGCGIGECEPESDEWPEDAAMRFLTAGGN